MVLVAANVFGVCPTVADATPANRGVARASSRVRPVGRVEVRHSVVVIGAKADPSRDQAERRHPLSLTEPSDGAELLRQAPNVRCDVCASTAAGAQPGQQSIFVLDLRSITNRLTTVQFRGATLKVTSFSPLGLQFRKPF